MSYDYLEAIKDDVRQYITEEEVSLNKYKRTLDELAEKLGEKLWTDDKVKRCDVIIRCYFLDTAISEVIDETNKLNGANDMQINDGVTK